ncbi:hypothetical protein [Gordonia sp. MMO-8]|uniref:hypothetical protein n=1 Tax=Gordonia sp. MMO-8 TaxID=3127886 RepID=UPI00301A30D1
MRTNWENGQMIQASDLNTMGTEVNQASARATASQTLAEAADGKATSALSTANDAASVATDAADAVAVAGETAKWNGIPDKPTFFPPENHQHSIEHVDGLQDILDDIDGVSEAMGAAIAIIFGGGAAGQVWTSGGPDGDPSWETPTGGGGGGLSPGVAVTGPYAEGKPTGDPVVGPVATNYWQMLLGSNITPGAQNNALLGRGINVMNNRYSVVTVGLGCDVDANQVMVLGAGTANHGNSVVITSPGSGTTTTKTYQILLGTPSHDVTIPGRIEIGSGAAKVTLYTEIVGGKSVLKAQHATGAAVTVSTEP